MSKRDGFGHEKPNEGETNDWITPQWVMRAFDNLSPDKGMFFDLDPCISLSQPWVTARNAYSIEQNGLLQNWEGMVYCNPPYGPHVGTWAKRMTNHGNGIMLIFARMETETWFEDIFPNASGFLFPQGRIAFYRPDGTRGHEAGAPSVLVSYGIDARNALMNLCHSGMKDDKNEWRTCVFLERPRA